MRVLLSSDWRLGRAFHGADLLAEQTALVDQVVAAAREQGVGAVLLAGGLLDPDADQEASELLEHAFSRLVIDEKIPVVALVDAAATIPGRGVLARVGLHLVGTDADPSLPIELADPEGSVFVHALGEPAGPEAFNENFEAAKRACRAGARSLLLGRLPVGAEASLPKARAWKAFAAAGLGGRGRSAELVAGRAWTAGSPLPWDFDDADVEGTLSLLEIDAKGRAKRETLTLKPARAVRRLEGRVAELLAMEGSPDRLRLVVTDEGPAAELGELLGRFPGLLEIDRPAPAIAGCDPAALFAEYYRSVEDRPLSAPERALVDEALA